MPLQQPERNSKQTRVSGHESTLSSAACSWSRRLLYRTFLNARAANTTTARCFHTHTYASFSLADLDWCKCNLRLSNNYNCDCGLQKPARTCCPYFSIHDTPPLALRANANNLYNCCGKAELCCPMRASTQILAARQADACHPTPCTRHTSTCTTRTRNRQQV